MLNRVIYYSNVVDASGGNVTINNYLTGTGNYLLVANLGGEDSAAVYILTARNGTIYRTAIKTVSGISVAVYNNLLGVTYSAPNVGVMSITKLTH